MSSKCEFRGKVGFAVGTGRCGTTFLAEVIGKESGIAASHCREPLIETFHRYCQWYDLPVDDAGFQQVMEDRIRTDLANHRFSFESSGYLSLSVAALFERFDARFVLLVRQPADVVISHVKKGWYSEPFQQQDPELALGCQRADSFHHFLGRQAPRGEEFVRWNAMTQIGKLAWFWASLNQAVIDQFAEIPECQSRIVRLEDIDFECYLGLADFLGFNSSLTESEFRLIAGRRPNASRVNQSVTDWTEAEADEFELQVASVAKRLGYEYRVNELRARTQGESRDAVWTPWSSISGWFS